MKFIELRVNINVNKCAALKINICIPLIQRRLLWALAIVHWEAIVWA